MSKKKTANKYQKKDMRSHALARPDMYIGYTSPESTEAYVVVDENFHIEKRTITISPGIVRMFIEPLSNVIDNVARSKEDKTPTTKIKVTLDEQTGEVSFWNDGAIVPIEMHPEEKCYNHTLIFSHFLSGSNYNDEEDRENISGRNGIGIKAVNVFSKSFTVEGADPINRKKFVQTWTNNMESVDEPEITSYKLKKGYTKITYTLDFERFGVNGYDADVIALYKKLLLDAAMVTKLPVHYNDEIIKIPTLQKYAEYYSTEEQSTKSLLAKTENCEAVITEILAPKGPSEVIAFANGIYNSKGGTHASAWTEAFLRPILDKLNKPKNPPLNMNDIKPYFRIFVNASVKKPVFESQEKHELKAPAVNATVEKKQINSICKWPVIERVKDIIRRKEMGLLKKVELKKRGFQKVEGLISANKAGTKYSSDCTLIIVEGLSAATFAQRGIEKGIFGKKGPDWFSILPIRGKVMNCRESKIASIAKNPIVGNIIKALGLRHDADYTKDSEFKKLQCGRVLILTDADVDGVHISGLIQNMFHALFPSLLRRKEPFLTSMQTPIVRVGGEKGRLFYSEEEYREFVRQNEGKKIDKKYYKGLGSSNARDINESFAVKMINFYEDEKTFDYMNLGFGKKNTDARKEWLNTFNPENSVFKWKGNEYEELNISHSEFIDKELIKFSIDDCARSIPHLMDGLKEGHRKILYTCFEKNISYTKKKPIKVAQLSGLVSGFTDYHHGEQNLENTIKGMAASFVGGNNIPLLYRDGEFGTRREGGKDAAQGRYIFTKMDMLTRLIFRKEDDMLLDYREEDGNPIEPKFYVPIIPMLLVNGATGIGTGWSTNISCYNPTDLIECIKAWMLNEKASDYDEETDTHTIYMPEILPWYRGYNGEIEKLADHKFASYGTLEYTNKGDIRVTELPVGVWTMKYIDLLDSLKEQKTIKGYERQGTVTKIDFLIKTDTELDHSELGLIEKFADSNMVMFTEDGKIKKYDTPHEIIDAFCKVRYNYYIVRKKHQLAVLEHEIKYLGNRKRFLEEVRDGDLQLFTEKDKKKESRKTSEIVAELAERGYDKEVPLPKAGNYKNKGDEGDSKDEDESDIKPKEEKKHGYEYLLSMRIDSITAEKINKLTRDIANKEDSHEKLTNTSEKEIWTSELDELQEAYEKYVDKLKEEDELLDEITEGKKKKKGKK